MEKAQQKNNPNSKEFNSVNLKKYFQNQKLPKDMNTPFTDEYFPPNDNSLLGLDDNGNPTDPDQYDRDVKDIDKDYIIWKRASEIFPEFLLFEGKIEADDIKQGNLGNCYFLSSLAALTEFPNLLYKIFKTKQVSPIGLYEIAMFIDGEWQIVIVDDYLPVNSQTGDLSFARPNDNELWVIILEKAWAKVNGGYLNTIGGFASEPLGALTGFSKRCIESDLYSEEELWKILRDADANDNIMCCATRNNKECEEKNLVALHAYTLIEAKQYKNLRLLKLRNPHGSKEWNGDYCDNSPLWTEELNKVFKHEITGKRDLDDGTFFITLEDFKKFFRTVYICFSVYDSQVKNFKIEKSEINKAQVFSFYIPKESEVSVTVHAPFWRYNRHLKNRDHPISILLAKVDEKTNELTFIDGDFSAEDDPSVKLKLSSGFYLIWTYFGVDENNQRIVDFYMVKFCANSKFNVIKEKPDEKLLILYKILISGIREVHKNEIASNEKFGTMQNKFKTTGFGYYSKFNNTKSGFMKFEIDPAKIQSYSLLPPGNSSQKFELYGPPGAEVAIFGLKTAQYASFWFNPDIKIFTSDEYFDEDNYKGKSQFLKSNKLEKFFDPAKLKVVPADSFYDYMNATSEDAKYSMEFKNLDMSEIEKEQLIEEFPNYMEKIGKFDKKYEIPNNIWKKITFTNGLYLGQINSDDERDGLGCYVFEDKNYILGAFNKNEKNGPFEEYDDKQNLIFKGLYLKGKKNGMGVIYYDNGAYYEGEFKNNVKHGMGTLYYSTGEKYVGNFVDNKKEGKGVYYYGENEYWDGSFHDNEFHGTGKYYSPGSEPVLIKFNMGQQE